VLQNQAVRKTTYASANAMASWSRRRPSAGSDRSRDVSEIEEAF
jgi:hypothetical protein